MVKENMDDTVSAVGQLENSFKPGLLEGWQTKYKTFQLSYNISEALLV